jgi:hypothetical protein
MRSPEFASVTDLPSVTYCPYYIKLVDRLETLTKFAFASGDLYAAGPTLSCGSAEVERSGADSAMIHNHMA